MRGDDRARVAVRHSSTFPDADISDRVRVGQIAIGSATAVAGIILLSAARSALAGVMDVALILAWLDLIVTQGRGYPPYQKLGHSLDLTRSTT